MPVEYKFLTPGEQEFFLKHGWIKIPNAINKKYIDDWVKSLWVRTGWDESKGPRSWEAADGEYVKVIRHKQAHFSEFAPDAYKACIDLCGGMDRIDPLRNMHGDQFIINNGSEYWENNDSVPQNAKGWHTDNDWYRQFLDSSENALVVVHLFTDIPPRGGGTCLCEDGIAGVLKVLYDNKQGLDSPFTQLTMAHIKDCKEFTSVSGKAGDTFIMHSYLPHTNGPNHLRTPRIITNPHVTLKEPFNLDRADPSDYSLIEQVILSRLGRERIPEAEYRDPNSPRLKYRARNFRQREAKREVEIARLEADAQAKGLEVDSMWVKGGAELNAFFVSFGLDLPPGPNHAVQD